MTDKDKLKEFFDHSSIFISCVKSEDFWQDDYYKICLEMLQIEGRKLESVEPERFTAEQYLNLCSTAIDQNGSALEWVEASAAGVENYQNLCYQAVKKNGTSLYFVKRDLFDHSRNKLREIYRIAVIQNTDALMLIQDQTLPLCRLAVKRNASALQWVNPELFSKEEYGEICFLAFYQKQELILLERLFGEYFDIKYIKNYQALRFVDKSH
ncbi:MAG: hypothetical protein LBV16_05600, partial [Elusimicrobiota bacterium]|nr:hypothetical protein [Elusimicrobiota bacterium]